MDIRLRPHREDELDQFLRQRAEYGHGLVGAQHDERAIAMSKELE